MILSVEGGIMSGQEGVEDIPEPQWGESIVQRIGKKEIVDFL